MVRGRPPLTERRAGGNRRPFRGPRARPSAGSDWLYNPSTQIRWGLTYIAQRYGTPCNAWKHEQQYHWYLKTGDAGGVAAGAPAR